MTLRFSKASPFWTYTKRSICSDSEIFSVNTAARGTAVTLSAEATGILMLAVMPGRTRGSTFFNTMRAAKPLILFLMVACGAMRSTVPVTRKPGTASTVTSTTSSGLSRGTSAWLTCALMIIEFRSAIVSTSVPLLNPPEPDTAWPIETGRVRIVQSKGARTSVLVSRSSMIARSFCDRSSAFLARS